MCDRSTLARMLGVMARVATLSLLTGVPGCNGTPTQPGAALTLSVRMDDTQLDIDDRSTLTMTLTNGSGQEIALTFPSACQLLPHVDRAGTNERVHVGGQVCATDYPLRSNAVRFTVE